MEKNVGLVDRGIRIVLGLAAFALGWNYGSWWGLVGIIPIATGFMRSCPLYLPFGLNTCKRKK